MRYYAQKLSWNQLFSNFFSKNVDLTEKCWFSRKNRDRVIALFHTVRLTLHKWNRFWWSYGTLKSCYESLTFCRLWILVLVNFGTFLDLWDATKQISKHLKRSKDLRKILEAEKFLNSHIVRLWQCTRNKKSFKFVVMFRLEKNKTGMCSGSTFA